MSGPDTRPLGDNYPSVNVESRDGSSTSSKIEINSTLPYFWFTGVLAALALGLAIGAFAVVQRNDSGLSSELDRLEKRVNVSENHFRNDEVELLTLKNRVNAMENSHARN